MRETKEVFLDSQPEKRSNGTVLVVNDERVQLYLLSRLIETIGFHTLRCEDVESALRILGEERTVDLVVTDIEMPGMDGCCLCRTLRSPAFRRYNGIPIVVTSAGICREKAESLTTEFTGTVFLPAPVDPVSFRKVVLRLLQRAAG